MVFVYIMAALQTAKGSFTPSLLFTLGLVVVSILLITQMKDPSSQPAPAVQVGEGSSDLT